MEGKMALSILNVLFFDIMEWSTFTALKTAHISCFPHASGLYPACGC